MLAQDGLVLPPKPKQSQSHELAVLEPVVLVLVLAVVLVVAVALPPWQPRLRLHGDRLLAGPFHNLRPTREVPTRTEATQECVCGDDSMTRTMRKEEERELEHLRDYSRPVRVVVVENQDASERAAREECAIDRRGRCVCSATTHRCCCCPFQLHCPKRNPPAER